MASGRESRRLAPGVELVPGQVVAGEVDSLLGLGPLARERRASARELRRRPGPHLSRGGGPGTPLRAHARPLPPTVPSPVLCAERVAAVAAELRARRRRACCTSGTTPAAAARAPQLPQNFAPGGHGGVALRARRRRRASASPQLPQNFAPSATGRVALRAGAPSRPPLRQAGRGGAAPGARPAARPSRPRSSAASSCRCRRPGPGRPRRPPRPGCWPRPRCRARP